MLCRAQARPSCCLGPTVTVPRRLKTESGTKLTRKNINVNNGYPTASDELAYRGVKDVPVRGKWPPTRTRMGIPGRKCPKGARAGVGERQGASATQVGTVARVVPYYMLWVGGNGETY